MYENLLAQERAASALAADVRGGTMPPALLFAGPPASGKLTAALETARLLSCEGSGEWNCPCSACASHRELQHPDFLLLGKRTFPEEIAVAKELVLRQPGQGSAYFFVRAVRKLLCRFAPPLWEGEESKLSKAANQLSSAEEALGSISPEKFGQAPDKASLEAIEAAASSAFALEAFAPSAPPVSMIRNVEAWSRYAPRGRRKTVIIENADSIQESGRNAMLKILEEPPESVRFILITPRRASMLATIMSRARIYHFTPRTPEAVRQVLSRVFKTDEETESVEAFLQSRMSFPPAEARRHAEAFAGNLFLNTWGEGAAGWGGIIGRLSEASRADALSDAELVARLAEAAKGFGGKEPAFAGSFPRFLRALLDVFSDALREAGDDTAVMTSIARWSALVRDAAVQHSSLNRNPEFLLEVIVSSFGAGR